MSILVTQNIVSNSVDYPVAYAKDIRYATEGSTQTVYEKIESLPQVSEETIINIAASAASAAVAGLSEAVAGVSTAVGNVSNNLEQLESDLGYSNAGFDIQVGTGNVSITNENNNTIIKLIVEDAVSGFNGMILCASGAYLALNGATAYKMMIDPGTRNIVIDPNDALLITNQ